MIAKVPENKWTATQRFVDKVERIFTSMEEYYITSMTSRAGPGILRKDLDRYDDAMVEARGDVPDFVIAYIEEVNLALRTSFRSVTDDTLTTRFAKRNAMKLFLKSQP